MFFRKTWLLPFLLLFLDPTLSAAQVRLSGQVCFDNAVMEAEQGGDLQTILHRHISIRSIAANAAWQKWGIRWNDLTADRQQAAITGVQNALELFSDDFFNEIDLQSLYALSDSTPYGYRVWGSYQTRGNMSDDFELSITEDCRVVRIVFNNIRLSNYIANHL